MHTPGAGAAAAFHTEETTQTVGAPRAPTGRQVAPRIIPSCPRRPPRPPPPTAPSRAHRATRTLSPPYSPALVHAHTPRRLT